MFSWNSSITVALLSPTVPLGCSIILLTRMNSLCIPLFGSSSALLSTVPFRVSVVPFSIIFPSFIFVVSNTAMFSITFFHPWIITHPSSSRMRLFRWNASTLFSFYFIGNFSLIVTNTMPTVQSAWNKEKSHDTATKVAKQYDSKISG